MKGDVTYDEIDAFLDRVASSPLHGPSRLTFLIQKCLDRFAEGRHVKQVRQLTDRVVSLDRELSDAKVREVTEDALREGIGGFRLGYAYYEGGVRKGALDPTWVFFSIEVGADVNNHVESTVVRLRFKREPWSEECAWQLLSLTEASVLFGDPTKTP